MDSEQRHRLERIETLVEENNTMVKKLYRAMRWNRATKIAYFVIIIGASLGIFYFLQPYLERVGGTYQTIQSTFLSSEGTEDVSSSQ